MPTTFTVTFRIRRDTAANWTSVDPVLALAEPGLETDTNRVKYGDGSTAWSALPYAGGGAAWGGITGTLSDQTDLQTALDDKADAASLGTAAAEDVGTSGATVPLLNGVNTWAAKQTFSLPFNLTPAAALPTLANGDLVQLKAATVRRINGRIYLEGPAPMATILPLPGSLSAYGVCGFGTTGTFAAEAMSTSSLAVALMRTMLGTGASAGALAGIGTNKGQFVRGNAAGIGGYAILHRFAGETFQAGQRGFFGHCDGVNGTPALANIDPTTSTTTGKVGIGFNTNSGNWQLIHNTAGAAPTVTDLGATLPLNTTDVMSLLLWAEANGSDVGYLVSNETTGAAVTGSITTNLPGNTVFQNPWYWWTNNATAANVRFRLYGSAFAGGF